MNFAKSTAVLICGSLIAVASTQRWVPDATSIKAASKTLTATLTQLLAKHGCDPEKQHVDIAFGFATSHFSKDPAPAAAARALASQVVSDFMVGGDQVYSFAWEFGVWDHRPGEPKSATIKRGTAEDLLQYGDLWPLTTKANSQGGHDTERAIVDIASQVTAGQTVLVLIANSDGAATTTVSGSPQTMGQDDLTYLSTIEKWDRIPSENKSGASLELKYIATTDGRPSRERPLDVIILVPRRWQAAPLGSGSRSSQLAKALPHVTSQKGPVESTSGSSFPWAAPLLFILAVAAAGGAVRLLRPKGPTFLRIGNRSFNLAEAPPGERLCRLVGPGVTPTLKEDVVITKAPPIVLGEILARADRWVDVEAKDRLTSINGMEKNLDGTRCRLKPKGEYVLGFEGPLIREGLPPSTYSVEATFSFHGEDHQNA